MSDDMFDYLSPIEKTENYEKYISEIKEPGIMGDRGNNKDMGKSCQAGVKIFRNQMKQIKKQNMRFFNQMEMIQREKEKVIREMENEYRKDKEEIEEAKVTIDDARRKLQELAAQREGIKEVSPRSVGDLKERVETRKRVMLLGRKVIFRTDDDQASQPAAEQEEQRAKKAQKEREDEDQKWMELQYVKMERVVEWLMKSPFDKGGLDEKDELYAGRDKSVTKPAPDPATPTKGNVRSGTKIITSRCREKSELAGKERGTGTKGERYQEKEVDLEPGTRYREEGSGFCSPESQGGVCQEAGAEDEEDEMDRGWKRVKRTRRKDQSFKEFVPYQSKCKMENFVPVKDDLWKHCNWSSDNNWSTNHESFQNNICVEGRINKNPPTTAAGRIKKNPQEPNQLWGKLGGFGNRFRTLREHSRRVKFCDEIEVKILDRESCESIIVTTTLGSNLNSVANRAKKIDQHFSEERMARIHSYCQEISDIENKLNSFLKFQRNVKTQSTEMEGDNGAIESQNLLDTQVDCETADWAGTESGTEREEDGAKEKMVDCGTCDMKFATVVGVKVHRTKMHTPRGDEEEEEREKQDNTINEPYTQDKEKRMITLEEEASGMKEIEPEKTKHTEEQYKEAEKYQEMYGAAKTKEERDAIVLEFQKAVHMGLAAPDYFEVPEEDLKQMAADGGKIVRPKSKSPNKKVAKKANRNNMTSKVVSTKSGVKMVITTVPNKHGRVMPKLKKKIPATKRSRSQEEEEEEEIQATPVHKNIRREVGKKTTPFSVTDKKTKTVVNIKTTIPRFRIADVPRDVAEEHDVNAETIERMNQKVGNWEAGCWDNNDEDLDVAMKMGYQPGGGVRAEEDPKHETTLEEEEFQDDDTHIRGILNDEQPYISEIPMTPLRDEEEGGTQEVPMEEDGNISGESLDLVMQEQELREFALQKAQIAAKIFASNYTEEQVKTVDMETYAGKLEYVSGKLNETVNQLRNRLELEELKNARLEEQLKSANEHALKLQEANEEKTLQVLKLQKKIDKEMKVPTIRELIEAKEEVVKTNSANKLLNKKCEAALQLRDKLQENVKKLKITVQDQARKEKKNNGDLEERTKEVKKALKLVAKLKKEIPCKNKATCRGPDQCEYSHVVKYADAGWQPTKAKPCFFYFSRSRSCTRKDCEFSHDEKHREEFERENSGGASKRSVSRNRAREEIKRGDKSRSPCRRSGSPARRSSSRNSRSSRRERSPSPIKRRNHSTRASREGRVREEERRRTTSVRSQRESKRQIEEITLDDSSNDSTKMQGNSKGVGQMMPGTAPWGNIFQASEQQQQQNISQQLAALRNQEAQQMQLPSFRNIRELPGGATAIQNITKSPGNQGSALRHATNDVMQANQYEQMMREMMLMKNMMMNHGIPMTSGSLPQQQHQQQQYIPQRPEGRSTKKPRGGEGENPRK